MTIEIDENDPDRKDDIGRTALHYAAAEGDVYAVRYLVRHGAQIDITDYGGITPLMIAVREGQDLIMHMLINAGADVNKADKAGETPLHWAAFKTRGSAAAILLNAGADATIRDLGDRKPVDMLHEPRDASLEKILHDAEILKADRQRNTSRRARIREINRRKPQWPK